MISIKKIAIFTLFVLLLSGRLLADGREAVFTGLVTTNQQIPVAFYPVFIERSNDSLDFIQTFTDENGIYSEMLEIDSGEVVTVSLFDCEDNEQHKVFYTPDSVNIADFSICVSSFNCSAFFQEEQDLDNPMAYYFYNLSEGNYNQLIWDFDDGTNSDEEDPYHVFQQEGTYYVSLMIMDTSSPTGCFDVYMQEVVVGEQSTCVADFTFSLDTLNNIPFVYRFSNQSTGDSLDFFWDFGDGGFSVEESPYHTYSEGGEYEVTLLVQDIDGFCFDEIIKTIYTPDYYDFGGQVFMGDYPININPDDSANSAVANLYRKMEGRWHYVDSREFWQLGYYWFTNKLEGDYLIEVGLNQGSLDYDNYAPGYFVNASGWQNASTFTLNGDAFEESVNLTPLAPLDNGIFEISGCVVFDSTRTGNITDTLPGVLVQLFNQEGNMVKYTYSNQLGEYAFDNLPGGTYSVRGEVVGICSSKTTVNLTDANPFEDNIRVTVFDCGNIGIDENPTPDQPISALLFPVPASSQLSIQLNSSDIGKVKIDIYNVQGKMIYAHKLVFREKGELKVDVDTWTSGIYLVNILNSSGNMLLSKKIIISH